MPPVLIAFFILIGASTGAPLVKGLVTPKDPTARPKWGEPAPQEYRTWTSRPWIAVADRATRQCDVTFFALATRNRVVRLVAGGQEQQLDWSWSFTRQLKEGEHRTIAFEFRDPVGGKPLACYEESLTCYSQAAGAADSEVREGKCAPPAVAPGRKEGGKPHLTIHSAPFTMMDPGIGGAYVDVTFEIVGTINEEWYCPAIDVTWPDDTHSKVESDCVPFDEKDADTEPAHRWKFNHGFPGGEWKVRACLSKSGKQLACEEAIVRVLGDQANTPFMGDAQNR